MLLLVNVSDIGNGQELLFGIVSNEYVLLKDYEKVEKLTEEAKNYASSRKYEYSSIEVNVRNTTARLKK